MDGIKGLEDNDCIQGQCLKLSNLERDLMVKSIHAKRCFLLYIRYFLSDSIIKAITWRIFLGSNKSWITFWCSGAGERQRDLLLPGVK